MRYAIGIDLGGTRLKSAVVTESGEVIEGTTEDTGHDEIALWTAKVKEHVAAFERRLGPAARIAVTTPGLASRDGRSVVDRRGRLSGLVGLDWGGALETAAP